MTSFLIPLLLASWLLGDSGAAASEEAVDENGATQVHFAADPWAERQADLEGKWGFEVCLLL